MHTSSIEFSTPAPHVGEAPENVLTLEIDNKYMPDTLGVKDIYDLYG